MLKSFCLLLLLYHCVYENKAFNQHNWYYYGDYCYSHSQALRTQTNGTVNALLVRAQQNRKKQEIDKLINPNNCNYQIRFKYSNWNRVPCLSVFKSTWRTQRVRNRQICWQRLGYNSVLSVWIEAISCDKSRPSLRWINIAKLLC